MERDITATNIILDVPEHLGIYRYKHIMRHAIFRQSHVWQPWIVAYHLGSLVQIPYCMHFRYHVQLYMFMFDNNITCMYKYIYTYILYLFVCVIHWAYPCWTTMITNEHGYIWYHFETVFLYNNHGNKSVVQECRENNRKHTWEKLDGDGKCIWTGRHMCI